MLVIILPFALLLNIVSFSTADHVIDCKDGGHFHRADPDSCSHFYKCDNGVPVRFSCPEHTLYNTDSHNCDWRGNVDCGTRPVDWDGDEYDNNGGDNVDNFSSEEMYNNGDNKNGDNFRSEEIYNNGDNNNGDNSRSEEMYNNGDDNNGGKNIRNAYLRDDMYSNEDEDGIWEANDHGTKFNPLQIFWGPGLNVPESVLQADVVDYPTIDDAYQQDHYYDQRDTDQDIDNRKKT